MDVPSPAVTPFKYVLIPADDAKTPSEVSFPGGSDEEFRASIQQYFRKLLLSQDQKNEMAKHLMEKAKENDKREGDKTNTNITSEQQNGMIADYLEQTSFEIVPILMPGRENKFIGTSLYIDDSGRFKDLALNSRASKIAQRDIRGDAFLLRNHDDPALDEWSRVDCTLNNYEDLYINPPKTQYDASNRAQMASAALARESDTKRISEEDVEKAKKAKEDGNVFFAAGDLKAAVQAYSDCIELTEGRRDLLPNEMEATNLRLSALLNRSLCLHRLGKNDEAAKDARTAIHLDNNNVKAYHRLTVALCGSRDYDAATEALHDYERLGGETSDTASIRQAIVEGRKQLNQEQKKKYSKLFA
ncbi:malate dehydrogenase (quinone) [Trypanosoma theileri]|uniref:Malate dehydrogenase (Quinone) n=1 Tax=Trypanosoma theileri TaxID=67003 RepID=A0A1X0P430_9TRYP|nr:malate dehydrogenase (quinone) [Trypanosoma theileri]ORC91423.1 malate dehydrogenase (quinone) [Trypanosoma theileri]